MPERHEINLKVTQRFASIVNWVDDRRQVAADVQELVRAIMLMFAGNPSKPHTVRLGGETFRFATGPIFENFLNEKAGASGKRWKALSPPYEAARKHLAGLTKKGKPRKFKILTLTGKLWKAATSAESITLRFDGRIATATMIIDSNKVPYARIHDVGGTIPGRFVKPRRATALHWMWMIQGGQLISGNFYSLGHWIGPAIIPQREFLTIGATIPPRFRSVLNRMVQAWFNGIAKRGGAGERVEYSVKSTG